MRIKMSTATRSRQSWVSRNRYRVTVSDVDTWQHVGKHNHADTDQHDWHTALLVSVLLLTQGRINPGRHVARANKVCTVVPKRYFSVLSRELASRNPSENLEFWGGFRIFGKSVYPSLRPLLDVRWRVRLLEIVTSAYKTSSDCWERLQKYESRWYFREAVSWQHGVGPQTFITERY